MKRLLLISLVVALASGCGSTSKRSLGPSAGGAQRLTGADRAVMSRVSTYLKDWNVAARKWSNAHKGGNALRFMKVHRRLTQRLYEDAMHIRLLASHVQARKLRSLTSQLGAAYLREFRACVAVDNSLISGDLRAGQRAVARLQRVWQAKIPIVTRLSDSYPELSGIG
jgi:hypothetical protein